MRSLTSLRRKTSSWFTFLGRSISSYPLPSRSELHQTTRAVLHKRPPHTTKAHLQATKHFFHTAASMASTDQSSLEKGPAPKHEEQWPMTNWVYDVFLWTLTILVDLFFREVHPRGSWKVPRRGPVIFVAAPHANQVCRVCF